MRSNKVVVGRCYLIIFSLIIDSFPLVWIKSSAGIFLCISSQRPPLHTCLAEPQLLFAWKQSFCPVSSWPLFYDYYNSVLRFCNRDKFELFKLCDLLFKLVYAVQTCVCCSNL